MRISSINSFSNQQVSAKNNSFKAKFASTPSLEKFKSNLPNQEKGLFDMQLKFLEKFNDNRIFKYHVDKANKIAKITEDKIIDGKETEVLISLLPVSKAMQLFDQIHNIYVYKFLSDK